jgi:hypothetical protein
MNAIVYREPISPEQVKQDIDDVFVFNSPMSQEHATSCEKIQAACHQLARVIADEVPEGRERSIAINNLLAVALVSRHGITRRQVLVVGVASPSPELSPVESSPPENPTSPVPQNPAT